MENKMEEFIKLLEEGKDQLRVPGLTEEDMQDIINAADNELHERIRQTDQARAAISFTGQQQQTVAQAYEEACERARAAAAESACRARRGPGRTADAGSSR